MSITLRKLSAHFAAEVSGVDLTGAVDDAALAEIVAAFEEHSVLVFPDQPFDDAAQLAFTERLGPLERTISRSPGGGRSAVAVLKNVDAHGRLLPVDHRTVVYNAGNELWHTDSSFKPIPARASFLSGRIVPPAGGETEFCSLRAAWAALPAADRERLEGKVAVHDFLYSRGLVDPGLLGSADRDELPPVRQALVRSNPANGHKGLYIGAHASYVEGMPVEAGRRLLASLLAHATQPQFVYRHRWRQHDAVMWDNRCCLHRGRPWDKSRYPRVMHRTTLAGDGPTAEPDYAQDIPAEARVRPRPTR